MKKLFLFLFLISLIYPSTSVLALSKSGSGLSSEVVTRKGRIDGISINDKWITFNGTSTSSKVRSTILNALKIRNKEEIITYRVNILDTTKIETNDKKPILLEELQIGDYAAVTGRVINEATNKIDEYKTEKVFLIEASYINVNNRRGVIEAISKAFSKYFQTGGLISVTNKSSIITNPDGTISLQPYDNTAERQGKCVGYGKPIVENRESAPVQPQVCCDGLKEYEALSVKFEEKPTVNIQGYVYTVKAYCYGLDGIPSDIIGKVFEKDDCISEGEPLLIGSILAPKVIQNCCEGLVECIASDYKAFPQPTGSEVISLNGFSYIVKGYCRKECPKSYSG